MDFKTSMKIDALITAEDFKRDDVLVSEVELTNV